MSRISVVIPILNESDYIGRLLKYLVSHSSSYNLLEIIVVDGGSTDNSIAMVQKLMDSSVYSTKTSDFDHSASEIKLFNSQKGRAKQMNLGAQNASGDILYFLHADSLPPKYFDQYIVDSVKNGAFSGCFRMKFDSQHWWLKLAGWFTQFNWKICRGGDQSLFVTKKLFDSVGGYDENYQIYEDNDLIAKLYKHGKFKVIQQWISSSARNYQKHGVWKLQYHYWAIHLKKRLGANPDELHTYYQKNI